MLLVLDNCEHVVERASAIAAALLKTCSKLTILATSRRPLAIPAETTYRPPPLGTPLLDDDQQLSAEEAQTFPAIALFVERARGVRPEFALADDVAPLVADICRRLDGIALAIELAAAQTRAMTVQELAERLDQRFRLLRDGRYADAPRQRTLAAAFDWSYALLDERRQRFFRALGIFAGAFTLEAALEICCEPDADELAALELVAALVDASLVVADSSGAKTRYRFLETTRAYAVEKQLEQGELPELAARHLEYHRAHAADIDLENDLEDVRAALRWALDGSAALNAGAELAATIGVQWEKVGIATEGAARLQAFIAAVGDDRPDLVARLWVALSFLRGNTLRFDDGLIAARNATCYARRVDDDAIRFNALRSLAVFASWTGNFAEARTALEEATSLMGQSPSPQRRLHVLAARGHLGRMSGDYADAIAAFEEARSIAQSLGDDYREVSAAVHISEAEHERGNTVRSVELMRDLAARNLTPIDAEPVLANLAGYLVATGDLDGARATVRAFFALPLPIARSTFATAILEHAALVAASSGDLARAARVLGYCEGWYRSTGQERQFTERIAHERLSALLEEGLTSEACDALKAEGAAYTAHSAVRAGLEVVELR